VVGRYLDHVVARPRLEALLDGASDRPFTLVTAPAGSGKTTLVEHWLADEPIRAAWCRLTQRHRDVDILHAALPPADALADIDLLVFDDVHTIHRSPAEGVIKDLLDAGSVSIMAMGRRRVSFDLSRLRLAGGLLELDGEDLRFRSWEIESLFIDGFRRPLVPEERSLLERKTNGWAAALHLFHLASAGRTDTERGGLLNTASLGLATIREYLISDIVAPLSPVLQEFLTVTAVLPVLTPELCDTLCDSSDSADCLRELEAANVFLRRLPDGRTFEYHEVFRTQLCMLVLEREGEQALRRRFSLAGELLNQRDYCAEALECYARAGDSKAVAALLDEAGAELVDDSQRWLEHLPPDLAEDDPWVLLARARSAVARADLTEARTRYLAAAQRFPASAAERICREEHRLVGLWDGSAPPDPSHWIGAARTVLDHGRVPTGVRPAPGPASDFVEGISAALTGRSDEARILFHHVLLHDEASDQLQVVAELVGEVFDGILRSADTERLVALADRMREVHLPWGQRLAMAAQALGGDPALVRSANLVVTTERIAGRNWLADVGQLLVSIGRLRAGETGPLGLDVVAHSFRSHGVRALACYAAAFEVVGRGRAGDPGIGGLASRTELEARTLGLRPVEAICLGALAALGERPSADVLPLLEKLENECGIDPAWLRRDPEVESTASATFSPPRRSALTSQPSSPTGQPLVRCQGSLVIKLPTAAGGAIQAVDVVGLKPRVRSLLCRLASAGGDAVSDDQLIDDLWPGARPGSGKRSLQVAVSDLRHAFEPFAGGGIAWVRRFAGGYCLDVPDEIDWDLRWLLREGRIALASDSSSGEVLGKVLDLAGQRAFEGEPITDWLAGLRAEHIMLAGHAARAAARTLIAEGRPDTGVEVLRRALEIDRYDDRSWKDLISLLDSLEHHSAALRVRVEYSALLDELDVGRHAV
jgi:DNA-binding SARP family transcriptional activator